MSQHRCLVSDAQPANGIASGHHALKSAGHTLHVPIGVHPSGHGQPYQLDFWWAGAQLSLTTGATTDQLQVSLGNQTQSTAVVANPSQGFTGWMFQTLYFTAQNNSEVLSFLAVGGPSGLPPFVLLDGVNLNAVPEPSTLLTASLAVGLFGIGAARRLRRRNTAAV
mgnify:CR=1 FL=1